MTQINLIFAADSAFCYRTSNAQKKIMVLNVNFIVLAKAPEYLETASMQLGARKANAGLTQAR